MHSQDRIKARLRESSLSLFQKKLYSLYHNSESWNPGNTFGLSFIVFHPRRLRLLEHSLFPPILPSAVLVIAATKATNHWGSDKSCHRLWPSLSPLPGKDRKSERVTQGSEPGKRKQPEEERKKYERTLRKNSTM